MAGIVQHTTGQLARLSGLTAGEVRRLARKGLLEARRLSNRRLVFGFQDLLVAKAAGELKSCGLAFNRMVRELYDLRQRHSADWFRHIGLGFEKGRVVVRRRNEQWHPATGQCVLPFESAVQQSEIRLFRRKMTPAELVADQAVDRVYYPEDWFNLGCELESSSPEGALQAYRNAIREEPLHQDAHLNAGRMLHQLGRLQTAEGHYRAALAIDPEDALAYFNLGVLMEDFGRTSEALRAYRTATRLDDSFYDAHYNLARLYESLGQKKHAVRHLRLYRKLRF